MRTRLGNRAGGRRQYVGVLLVFVLPQLAAGCSLLSDRNRMDVIEAIEAEGFAVTSQQDPSTAVCLERDGGAKLVSIYEFDSDTERREAHSVDELGTYDTSVPTVFWATGRVLLIAGVRPGEDDEFDNALTSALGDPVARVRAQFADNDEARFVTCAELFAATQ